MPCETWNDHEWSRRRFKEAGRVVGLGRFQRYEVTCERCARTRTETDWTEESAKTRDRFTSEGERL